MNCKDKNHKLLNMRRHLQLFQIQTPDIIILSLNRIMKSNSERQDEKLKNIAKKIFEKVSTTFSLKYEEIHKVERGEALWNETNLMNFKGKCNEF